MEELERIRLETETDNPFYLNDTKLFELYNNCLPPKESYYYFPKGEEIITIHHKKPFKSIRRVFYNQNYTDFEKKALLEFKQIINLNSLKLPDYFQDYFLLAFIYAEEGNLNKSYKRIIEYLKFCERTFPITISPSSKVIEILNKGFIYIYGRDKRFRPIIVCQANVFEKYYKEYQTEELLLATSFLCQFLINNMIIPGQYETWNMFVNLKGVSVISLPDPLKKLIPALSNYFLCRLNKTFIFGLNFLTRILYKIAVNFIDPVTVTKLAVISSNKDREEILFSTIRKDNVEKQFGGTAPNMPVDSINGFFPPRMPSSNFILDVENKNEILISEEEYINKYKNGEISDKTVNPYIYNKLKKEEIKESTIPNDENDNNPTDDISKKSKTNNDIITSEEPKSFINNENIMKDDKILNTKKIEIDKVNKIVKSNWHIDEELDVYKINYNYCFFKSSNIINDINKFGHKKRNIIKNIID